MFGKADKYVARTAFSMAKKALMALNVEYKCFDVQVTNGPCTTTPAIVQLTNIPQGDTAITRDGNQIKITRNLLRYSISGNSSAADQLIRVMLVLDQQTNQAIYSAADLLQDVSAFDSILSPLNLDNKFRFHVLYDKVHRLTSGANNSVYVNKMFNLQQRIRFDNSTPSIADLTSQSLSFLCVSNQATGSLTVTLFNRIRFVDN